MNFEVTPTLSTLLQDLPLRPEATFLGRVSYAEARTIQSEAIASRQRGESGDKILLCEHPTTLSLGPRTKESDLGFSLAEWEARGVTVVTTDRGGGPTLHLPGQLLFYPVISLRERGQGIRSFVQTGLNAIATALGDLDIAADAALEPAGVWVCEMHENPKKISAVGLRIRNGVSDHGFSLNVCCHLQPFTWFSPCGLRYEAASITEQNRAHCAHATISKLVTQVVNSML